MEQRINAMPAIRFDDAAPLFFGILFDDRAWVAEEHPRLHNLDGAAKTLACGFDEVDVRLCESGGADVVCFV